MHRKCFWKWSRGSCLLTTSCTSSAFSVFANWCFHFARHFPYPPHCSPSIYLLSLPNTVHLSDKWIFKLRLWNASETPRRNISRRGKNSFFVICWGGRGSCVEDLCIFRLRNLHAELEDQRAPSERALQQTHTPTQKKTHTNNHRKEKERERERERKTERERERETDIWENILK